MEDNETKELKNSIKVLDETFEKHFRTDKTLLTHYARLRLYATNKVSEESIKSVVSALGNMKWEEPVFHYALPKDKKDFKLKQLIEWFEVAENYWACAQHWEKQERGPTLSVDRAYSKYLVPRLKELSEFLGLNIK